MLGLFGTLNLGARALQAQQTGVEISGQNLANVNNPAYARQRVNMNTSPTVTTPVGPQGTGVQVVSIQQIRDAFLDAQIRDETSVGGFYNSQHDGLDSVQTALNEFLNQAAASVNTAADSGSAASSNGLASQISGLFNAFQSVAANPSSLGERQTLVNQAQSLANTFNQIASRLSSVNDGLNAGITQDVGDANKLLSQIAELNREISDAEAPGGGMANELRDQREQKLEALAGLVNIQTTTNPDSTISISINGTAMITGRQLNDTLQTYDPGNGQLQIQTVTGGTALTLTGGSIAGSISARDGGLGTLRNQLDTLASQMATQINSVYSSGYDLNGNTGDTFFSGNTAGTIAVNSSLLGDPSKVQVAGAAGASGDNSIALALARMADTKIGGLNNQTFGDAYGGMVINFGNAISNSSNEVANHGSVQALLSNRRDSVSGVSMEEEMASMMSYQKAYQAAARIVTTVDQMLDEVLNMKR